MNLPNKLTLSRILAVVVIMVFYFVFKDVAWNMYLIFALFLLASFTDFLDGKIARKYNMVTGFGKLMDPLADKLLVISVIIIFNDVMPEYITLWMLMIVIARELLVLGVRLVSLEQNNRNVIAADIFGKAKTATQMVSLTILLLIHAITLSVENGFTQTVTWIGLVLFYISMVLLVISGAEVFIKNRKSFNLK